jgi:hypothetical protein
MRPAGRTKQKGRAIAGPAPTHNEHPDEFDLCYCILQGF